MTHEKSAMLDELTQRLWRSESHPNINHVIEVLRHITDELRPELIRVTMSRLVLSKEELLKLLDTFPGNACLILRWIAYAGHRVEDLVYLLKETEERSVKEGLGLLVLGHPESGVASYATVAKYSPELQEHVWRLYQKESAGDGIYAALVNLAKHSPRLIERIAQYFLTSDYYLPGLLLGLDIPSTVDRSAEIILHHECVDGCVKVLEKIDLSSSLARRACYLLLQNGKDSFETMLSVMVATRNHHDSDFLTSRNRFVELLRDRHDEALLPCIHKALAILQPAGDPCRDVTIQLLEEILRKIQVSSSVSDAEHILQSMRALVT